MSFPEGSGALNSRFGDSIGAFGFFSGGFVSLYEHCGKHIEECFPLFMQFLRQR